MHECTTAAFTGNTFPSSGPCGKALLYMACLLTLVAVLFAVYMSVEDKW